MDIIELEAKNRAMRYRVAFYRLDGTGYKAVESFRTRDAALRAFFLLIETHCAVTPGQRQPYQDARDKSRMERYARNVAQYSFEPALKQWLVEYIDTAKAPA